MCSGHASVNDAFQSRTRFGVRRISEQNTLWCATRFHGKQRNQAEKIAAKCIFPEYSNADCDPVPCQVKQGCRSVAHRSCTFTVSFARSRFGNNYARWRFLCSTEPKVCFSQLFDYQTRHSRVDKQLSMLERSILN